MKSATETVSGVQSWKQTFLYDRYGNRNFDAANTTTFGSCPAAVCNPSVSPNNDNRLSSAHGYSYDAAGNTTVDAEGRQFTYDAENKQTLVRAASNATIGQYHYDGDGKRVKKSSNQENIVFVYDASGKLIEEYSGSTLQTSYVYAGSRLLTTETSAGTNYLTNDHLGTPRVNTDQSGAVTARHDYMPFGEEIFSYGGRTAGLAYTMDSVRKQFTGKERDAETDLDYFGARYYLPSLGRFSSSDPIAITPERILDPQRINLFGYTRNNPLKYTDPTGKDLELDPKQKPADADRIIKAVAEAYRREEGRTAIQRLVDSKLPVIFTNGEVPTPGKYGVTTLSGDRNGPQSVTITLDFGAIDKSNGEVTDLGVVSNELYHGQAAVESDRSFMRQLVIGLGVQAGDPEAIGTYELEQKMSNMFQDRVVGDKTTKSLEEAESEVRKLFGLPASPESAPKPSTPTRQGKPDSPATPAEKPDEERKKPY